MSKEEHFEFVKSLASELNRHEIELASFPDIVLRVRIALDNPDTTSENLATILSVDPVLASRILVLANSTYYNAAGIKIESLNAAVGRIGFATVRTTAISYAVELLHASEGLGALKSELRQTWSAALRRAAMSEVMARYCSKLNGDTAFIAGLLNQIGVLYIFTKYDKYPNLLQNPDARQNIIDEWAAAIGENIVANWDFSDEIQATLNPDENEAARPDSEPTLVDVVVAAKASLDAGSPQVCETPATERLKLTDAMMPEIMELFQLRVDSLASAVR
jgi:HD-like signal output (HDOD) protein